MTLLEKKTEDPNQPMRVEETRPKRDLVSTIEISWTNETFKADYEAVSHLHSIGHHLHLHASRLQSRYIFAACLNNVENYWTREVDILLFREMTFFHKWQPSDGNVDLRNRQWNVNKFRMTLHHTVHTHFNVNVIIKYKELSKSINWSRIQKKHKCLIIRYKNK